MPPKECSALFQNERSAKSKHGTAVENDDSERVCWNEEHSQTVMDTSVSYEIFPAKT